MQQISANASLKCNELEEVGYSIFTIVKYTCSQLDRVEILRITNSMLYLMQHKFIRALMSFSYMIQHLFVVLFFLSAQD